MPPDGALRRSVSAFYSQPVRNPCLLLFVVSIAEADAQSYFADRQAHGFNSVWINLLCDDYTAGRPDGTTFDGIAPFSNGMDFSSPNEAYFQRVDHMLALAGKYGLNVLLDPA